MRITVSFLLRSKICYSELIDSSNANYSMWRSTLLYLNSISARRRHIGSSDGSWLRFKRDNKPVVTSSKVLWLIKVEIDGMLEFMQTLKQTPYFQFMPRMLPLKWGYALLLFRKVLAAVKSEAVYHVSDINRDDFVMFRYELNNIFHKNFYKYRSPVRSRNLSPFHSTSGVLPVTSPSHKDLFKSTSAAAI